jgi:hypothetical protein
MAQNRFTKIVMPVAVVLALAVAAPAHAQRRGSGGGGHATAAPRGGAPVGTAVPRSGPAPYRGYGYGGYPGYYGYRGPYGYGYGGLYFGFGYPGFYGAYGYPWYGYPGYAYPWYGYPAYGYPGYAVGVRPYGSVRIDLPQKDAQVYADGYFAGSVEDFDGRFHHLNLEPGPHKIEVRTAGSEPIMFDVNVEPGQTITYRAAMRAAQQ